jgi:UDP-N-acetylglucosamine 2-epimerase (hydrolysing)
MKKILFLTGTRADYGKLKSLIKAVEGAAGLEPYIYVTGMHMLTRYGYTAQEVLKDGYKNVYMNINQHVGDHMEMALANTVKGMSHYIHELKPDLIVIHGDRLESLAGAIVGAFTNTLVAHVEGGELSGTIDDSIRHSISKMAHIHFVCNKDAYERLYQMGESKRCIYEIGSPDYDVMFNSDLPSLDSVLKYYEVTYNDFGIVLFHPVTTDRSQFSEYAKNLVNAINNSEKNFIVVYPNNDEGSDYIIDAYKELDSVKCKIFPSLSFERFIVLLKYSKCLIGNSSAGIREAPCYGVPTINIGDRQNKRFKHGSITNSSYQMEDILECINESWNKDFSDNVVNGFGDGRASERFIDILSGADFWETPIQKVVFDD